MPAERTFYQDLVALTMPYRHPSAPRQPGCGADYNAFGFDPRGVFAFLAAEAYGSDYVPDYNVMRFRGGVEPPRYGPPAPYQQRVLPRGWIMTPSPFLALYGKLSTRDPDLHDSIPKKFNRKRFECLSTGRRFNRRDTKEERQYHERAEKECKENLDREIAEDFDYVLSYRLARAIEKKRAMALVKKEEEAEKIVLGFDVNEDEGIAPTLYVKKEVDIVLLDRFTVKQEEEDVTSLDRIDGGISLLLRCAGSPVEPHTRVDDITVDVLMSPHEMVEGGK
ncbi:hypothetical protein DXG01_007815, partial [Tephrocybe rancida]